MAEVCIVRRTFGIRISRTLGWFDVIEELLGDVTNEGEYQYTLYQMVTYWMNSFMGEELRIQKFNNYLIINDSLLMISEFEWDKIVERRVIVYLECDLRRGFG
jgi:hypothetical protein